MQIFHYDSIASTSTEAFRLLSENVPTPFAVTAKQQTAGRGQHSRTWESPQGNFFLSIACSVPRERVRFLPLMTACTLAQWLETKLRDKPVIKWPNDLLMNWKKIAGILCEAFWDQTKTECAAVIGIGINIEEAPLLKESDYGVGCIKHSLIEEESTEELVLSFVEFWKHRRFDSEEEIIREFERHHLPKGQIWQHREDSNVLFASEGISREGHLLVRKLNTGETQELVSAQHPLILVKPKEQSAD